MAKRKVIWTETANLQLLHVLQYWLDRNQSNAYPLRLLDQVENQIASIVTNPRRCPRTRVKGIRVAAMGHYSIFYRISINELIVVAFWDNRQDPKKLLDLIYKHRQ